jgi:hypothetical protein
MAGGDKSEVVSPRCGNGRRVGRPLLYADVYLAPPQGSGADATDALRDYLSLSRQSALSLVVFQATVGNSPSHELGLQEGNPALLTESDTSRMATRKLFSVQDRIRVPGR